MSPRLREFNSGSVPLDAAARETTSPGVGFDSISTVFASVPPSAGGARRFVGAALRRWDVSDAVIEVALLLTSELVTNTYRHADSDARVSVLRRPGLVRVEVHDSGEGGVQRRPLDPEQPDGRGLNIVETLAQGWGCMSSEGGTLVWFELSIGDR